MTDLLYVLITLVVFALLAVLTGVLDRTDERTGEK